MQARHFMDEDNFETGPATTKRPFRVVIAYNDVDAGKRAMRVLSHLSESFGDEIAFHPLPWSFDLLMDVNWREVAASDAVDADILIVATDSPGALPPAVGRWAESAIDQKRGTHAAVVALFGPEENPDRTGSSRLDSIQTAAEQAGLDFFAPAPRHELDEAIERVRRRAKMVTPVLDKILHLESPLPDSMTRT